MDERPAQETSNEQGRRTVAVTLTLAFLIVSLIANIVGVVVSLYLLWQPDESQLLLDSSVSDWFWALSALLFAALAAVYAYVTRAVLARDAGAGLAVSILGLLGVGYSLLSITHAYGWGVLAVSLGMLASNQAATAQGYYTGHALSLKR